MIKIIYTVTFNPSLDYVMHLDEFKNGQTNRSNKETISIGGKGINVSLVLSNLNMKSTALGFASGFTGEYILKNLEILNIKNDFIFLKDSFSRINIKLKTDVESEINANGPNYTKKEIDELMSKFSSLKDGDTLILAGSIPKSMPSSIYSDIMRLLQDKDIKIVVDATDKLLLNVLKYKPFLIKPNISELEEMFDTTINDDNDIYVYAKKLLDMGAYNVIISMGANGAIFVNKDISMHINSPNGKLVNSVGAGDSMVAGFVYAINLQKSYEEAFKYSVACGSATAFSAGLATLDKVNELLKELE